MPTDTLCGIVIAGYADSTETYIYSAEDVFNSIEKCLGSPVKIYSPISVMRLLRDQVGRTKSGELLPGEVQGSPDTASSKAQSLPAKATSKESGDATVRENQASPLKKIITGSLQPYEETSSSTSTAEKDRAR